MGPEIALAPIWHRFTPDVQSLIRGIWPNFKGQAVHEDLRKLLENMDVELVSGEKSKVVRRMVGGKNKTRIYDDVFEGGLDTIFNVFMWPNPKRLAALVEAKLAGELGSPTQRAINDIIRDEIARMGSTITDKGYRRPSIKIDALHILSRNLRDIPEGDVVKVAERLFGAHLKGTGTESHRLSQEAYDLIIDRIRSWHRELRHEPLLGPGPTLGEMLVVTAAYAARLVNRAEESSEPA